MASRVIRSSFFGNEISLTLFWLQALRERAVRHRTGIGGIGQLTRSLLDREGDLSQERARGHLSARQAQLRSTLDNVMARAHDGDNTRGDEQEGPAPVRYLSSIGPIILCPGI